jgi:hypothetical protein
MRITEPAGRGAQQFRNVSGSLPASELVTVAQDCVVGDTVGAVMVQTMRRPVTVTLPRAETCSGRIIAVRKTDSGMDPVTVKPASGGTIDGAASLLLDTAGEYVQMQSDGSEWVRTA